MDKYEQCGKQREIKCFCCWSNNDDDEMDTQNGELSGTSRSNYQWIRANYTNCDSLKSKEASLLAEFLKWYNEYNALTPKKTALTRAVNTANDLFDYNVKD